MVPHVLSDPFQQASVLSSRSRITCWPWMINSRTRLCRISFMRQDIEHFGIKLDEISSPVLWNSRWTYNNSSITLLSYLYAKQINIPSSIVDYWRMSQIYPFMMHMWLKSCNMCHWFINGRSPGYTVQSLTFILH